MEDILVPLLFMAIFYLGPALLKRYREGKNTQPAIPERPNFEIMNPPPQTKKIPGYMASAPEVPTTMVVVDKTQSAPIIVEEQSAWRGKLDPSMIMNGVIFAEILQPPRAYRPFGRR